MPTFQHVKTARLSDVLFCVFLKTIESSKNSYFNTFIALTNSPYFLSFETIKTISAVAHNFAGLRKAQ